MLDLPPNTDPTILRHREKVLLNNPIVSDMETITALKSGAPLPAQKLVELRSKSMHTVRFEFIVRLLRLDAQIITLSIYWEDGRDFMQIPSVQNVRRKLVYASEPRVSGSFDDLALLCYPYDPESKAAVEAELDRMVTVIGQHGKLSSTKS